MNFFNKSKTAETKLQGRISNLQKPWAFVNAIGDRRCLAFRGTLGGYEHAIKIVSKSGIDAACDYFKTRPVFVPELVWRDIRDILNGGNGLFENVFEDLPGIVAAEQQAKKEKRELHDAQQLAQRREAKLAKARMVEEQQRRRAELEAQLGIKLI